MAEVKMEFIKSPINYTGNKYRLLQQFMQYFPEQTDVFVDLFCGGATVGCNVNAKKVFFIDNNDRVINLLRYIAEVDFEKLYKKLGQIVEKYNLSFSAQNSYAYYFNLVPPDNRNNGLKEYNKVGFYELRDDYNSLRNKDSEKAQTMLYMLMVYGFNNDIRFNRYGDFNLPVGKTDLNESNLKKIKDFSNRAKESNFTFVVGNFEDSSIQKTLFKADFVYADPPYLITCAVYNESNGWDEVRENALLELYSQLLKNKVNIAFSNVLSRGGIVNRPLDIWLKNNADKVAVHRMKYDYISSSYNKKNRYAEDLEILVRG